MVPRYLLSAAGVAEGDEGGSGGVGSVGSPVSAYDKPPAGPTARKTVVGRFL